MPAICILLNPPSIAKGIITNENIIKVFEALDLPKRNANIFKTINPVKGSTSLRPIPDSILIVKNITKKVIIAEGYPDDLSQELLQSANVEVITFKGDTDE